MILKARSFTLVEALVSMGLMAFLVTSTSFILIDTKHSQDEIWHRAQQAKHMHMVLDQIKQDLQSIYRPNDETQVLQAEVIEEGDGHKDSIAFVRVQNIDGSPQLVEVEYISSPTNPQDLMASESYTQSAAESSSGSFSLYRRFQAELDQQLQQGGHYELLISELEDLSIRYLEDETWTDMPSQLPRCIHISITQSTKRSTLTLETYVSLYSI